MIENFINRTLRVGSGENVQKKTRYVHQKCAEDDLARGCQMCLKILFAYYFAYFDRLSVYALNLINAEKEL